MIGIDKFFAADNEQALRDMIAKNKPMAFIGPVQIDAAFVARVKLRDSVAVWVEGVREVSDIDEQQTITGLIGGW